jgi:pimeloyl-ACP methyl ester carboxylesterase
MRVIVQSAVPGAIATTRVLLLPGAYHEPEHFVEAGFINAVRERGLPFDLYFVAPQLQHLTDRSVLRRLYEELIAPDRERGLRHVCLLGISLGGLLALQYAQQHPGTIDTLCLMAPYLGNRSLTAEIERAGGPALWQAGRIAPEDEERLIWRYIQQHGRDPMFRYLGFGAEDRFSAGHRLLAQALASARIDIIPGGHDWRTWRQLWDNFLDDYRH